MSLFMSKVYRESFLDTAADGSLALCAAADFELICKLALAELVLSLPILPSFRCDILYEVLLFVLWSVLV